MSMERDEELEDYVMSALRNGDPDELRKLLLEGEPFDFLEALHQAILFPTHSQRAPMVRMLLATALQASEQWLRSAPAPSPKRPERPECYLDWPLLDIVLRLADLPHHRHPLFTALLTAMRESWEPTHLLYLCRLGAPCTTQVFDACLHYGRQNQKLLDVILGECGWQMQEADLSRYLLEEVAALLHAQPSSHAPEPTPEVMWLFRLEGARDGPLQAGHKQAWLDRYEGCFGNNAALFLERVWEDLLQKPVIHSAAPSLLWCTAVVQTGECEDLLCALIHSPQQMRRFNPFYRSCACHAMAQQGVCSEGERCLFAHSAVQWLEARGYSFPAQPDAVQVQAAAFDFLTQHHHRLPCANREPHNRRSCPWYHHESDFRRSCNDVSVVQARLGRTCDRSTCRWLLGAGRQKASTGAEVPHVFEGPEATTVFPICAANSSWPHNWRELEYHPAFFKTQPCPLRSPGSETCDVGFPELCPYLHRGEHKRAFCLAPAVHVTPLPPSMRKQLSSPLRLDLASNRQLASSLHSSAESLVSVDDGAILFFPQLKSTAQLQSSPAADLLAQGSLLWPRGASEKSATRVFVFDAPGWSLSAAPSVATPIHGCALDSLRHCFSFLGLRDLNAVLCVCRRWHATASSRQSFAAPGVITVCLLCVSMQYLPTTNYARFAVQDPGLQCEFAGWLRDPARMEAAAAATRFCPKLTLRLEPCLQHQLRFTRKDARERALRLMFNTPLESVVTLLRHFAHFPREKLTLQLATDQSIRPHFLHTLHAAKNSFPASPISIDA